MKSFQIDITDKDLLRHFRAAYRDKAREMYKGYAAFSRRGHRLAKGIQTGASIFLIGASLYAAGKMAVGFSAFSEIAFSICAPLVIVSTMYPVMGAVRVNEWLLSRKAEKAMKKDLKAGLLKERFLQQVKEGTRSWPEPGALSGSFKQKAAPQEIAKKAVAFAKKLFID